MKSKIVVAAVVAAMLSAFAPSSAFAGRICPPKFVAGKHFGHGGGPWLIFACAGGIITSAIVANANQNRELTADEAMSCGLLYWVNPNQPH